MKKVLHCVPHVLLLSIGVGMSAAASAQNYPAKAVRVLIGYPPGGGVDFVGRLLAQKVGESWGQQVIIDSRPGGGGNIGTAIAAKAPADGYTLLLSPLGPLVINPSLFSKLPFDPVRDFEPVTSLISALNLLVVHPSLPVKTVKELVALAKSRPGQLKFASSSHGNTDHLAGELFNSLAGVKMVHVPYKGGAAATLDLVAGQVEVFFGPVQNVLANVQTGRLRMIAAATGKRWPTMPDLPTIAESGVPGFEVVNWYGLLTPARVPKEIIAQLNADFIKALQLPDVKEKLASNGMIAFPSTPEQFAAYIKAETTKWAKVVKDSGARVD